jgi:hypothetical protein
MRKTISTTFSMIGLAAIAFAFTVTSQAQITINLPKFPSIKKEKPQPSPTTTTDKPSETKATTAAGSTAATPKPAGACDDSTLNLHLKDIAKTRAEAEEFTPGLRNYYVSTLSDRKNRYLEAALLPKVRTDWLKTWSAESVNCMNVALDGLADAARKTIPGYFGPAGYTLGTPAEKKALHSAVDVSTGKVLRSGLQQASWLISKNSYDLPTSRYKYGYVLVQYPDSVQSGLCWVFWVNLVQEYSGGGTYGDSYGNYVGRDLAGCPKN